MKYIKVVIDRESGEISVENDGKGIPVEIHETEGVYVPQMVFGELLTGDNYDDGEDRVVGGRNGYGAKLANIFSTRFEVATCDKASGQIYKQGKSKAFVGPVLCLGCCVGLCLVSNTDLACVFLSHPFHCFCRCCCRMVGQHGHRGQTQNHQNQEKGQRLHTRDFYARLRPVWVGRVGHRPRSIDVQTGLRHGRYHAERRAGVFER